MPHQKPAQTRAFDGRLRQFLHATVAAAVCLARTLQTTVAAAVCLAQTLQTTLAAAFCEPRADRSAFGSALCFLMAVTRTFAARFCKRQPAAFAFGSACLQSVLRRASFVCTVCSNRRLGRAIVVRTAQAKQSIQALLAPPALSRQSIQALLGLFGELCGCSLRLQRARGGGSSCRGGGADTKREPEPYRRRLQHRRWRYQVADYFLWVESFWRSSAM